MIIRTTILPLLVLATTTAIPQESFDRSHGHRIIEQAAELIDQEKHDDAIQLLSAVHRSDSLYERSLLQSARAKSLKNDMAGAEADCLKGIALNGEFSGPFAIMRAAVLLDLKRYEDAVRACDSVIALHPGNFRIRHLKALSLAGGGDRKAALALAMDNARRFPYQRDAHALLGAIAQSEDRLSEAALAYMMAMIVRFDDRMAEQLLIAYDKCLGLSTEPSREGYDLTATGDDLDEITQLIKSKLAMDKKYKVKPDLTYPTCRQSHLLLNAISERKVAKPGFYERFYGPMAKAIMAQDRFEGYVYHCLSPSSVADVQAHATKNRSKVIEFRKWVTSVLDEHYASFPETENGEPLLHVYNNAGDLLAMGKGNLKTGLKSGEWTIYGDNGRISGRGTFNTNGEREGKWTHWQPNGRLESEGEQRNGQLNNAVLNYFDNGNLEDSTAFRNGRRHGPGCTYFRMGGRHLCRTAADGVWNGPVTEWHRAGQLAWEYALKEDKVDGAVKQLWPDGSTQYTGTFKDGNREGLHVEHHANGQRAEETTYAAGKGEGPFKAWHPNGQLAREGTLKAGLLYGERRFYDEWGTLRQIDRFGDNGKLQGLREEFARNGSKQTEFEYRNDLLVRYAYFDPNGKLIGEGSRSKGKFKLKGFSADGSLRVEGVYLDEGAKDGEWKYYQPDGTLDAEESYVEGKSTGTHRYYDAGGFLDQTEEWFERDGTELKILTKHYRNKQVREIATMKDGQADGVVRRYTHDGKVKSIEYFADGEREGWQEYYDPMGTIEYAERIDGGAVAERVMYDEQGREYERIAVKPGAFTMIGHFPSGKEMMRLSMMNGAYHGTSAWYYPDGSKEIETPYLNGLRHGNQVALHPNGKKRSEAGFVLGREEGIHRSWYTDGTLRLESMYKDGHREGVSTEFHPNGKPAITRTYMYGELHGPTVSFSLDGTPQMVRFYHKSKLVAYGSANADGTAKDSIPLGFGVVLLETSFPSGKPARRMTYRNEEIDGEFVEHHPNGQVMERQNYIAGLADGTNTSYYPDGKVMETATYTDGLLHGERVQYWDNGQVRERAQYVHGVLHGEWTLHDRTGKRVAKYRVRNDDVVEIGK